MLILGIESSCDETAAAVVEDGKKILANVIASQHDVHAPFGGVVPELASRRHVENMPVVIREALHRASAQLGDMDAIAVTRGPGLIGALLVGLSTAKAMAWAEGKPLIPVNHLHGHIMAAGLENDLIYPHICLLVSGGHTSLFRVRSPLSMEEIAGTRDDAAGEAFDKVSKMLGLGFPGGPAVERAAALGNGGGIEFPVAKVKGDPLAFSFSGLKTAVRNALKGSPRREDVAAAFQNTVVKTLVSRTMEVARGSRLREIVIAGGVACNTRLREEMKASAAAEGMVVTWPSPLLCTDNAAMIAAAGYHIYKANPSDESFRDFLSLDAVANLPLK